MFAEYIKTSARIYNDSNDATVKHCVKKGLDAALRQYADRAVEVKRVSKAAAEAAHKLGLSLENLRILGWGEQAHYDIGRNILHWEHFVPVGQLLREILSNPENTEEILSKAEVVWILKEEDSRLTQAGYRTKRPDAEAAYKEVLIELF